MPFEEPIKQDVQMSLGYGEQKNPVTGETFFHHGIDFSVNHYLLSAVATGTVSAIGSDAEASLQCLRQLLPKRQGRSDHRHQWRPAAHGGEV